MFYYRTAFVLSLPGNDLSTMSDTDRPTLSVFDVIKNLKTSYQEQKKTNFKMTFSGQNWFTSLPSE